MTILLLGAGPRFDWLRKWLERQRVESPFPIKILDGPPSREMLVELAGESISAIVLVDHRPFAAGEPAIGMSAIEAVRNEAQRAIFALELVRRSGRTVILGDQPAPAWPAILASLARLPEPSGLEACPPPLASKETGNELLARTYLLPLFAALNTSALVLTWPREAFFDGDAPGGGLPPVIEVAGRARILAYGPYLPLASGAWRATAYLGFSVDIERMPFILEVETGSSTVRGFFEVAMPGIFTLVLDFQVTDPMQPVELRLISQDSALQGQVALIEVQLEQGEPHGSLDMTAYSVP